MRVTAYHGNMPLVVPVLVDGATKHVWVEARLKHRPQQRAKVHDDVALVAAVKPKGSKHYNLSQLFNPPLDPNDTRERRKLTYPGGPNVNKWLIPVKKQFLFHRP